ncbi:CerR family C-terminal domain-containing protein [Glaciecola sp. XM2]|jgi:AcrR family transcriptional regulator|uniref:CerR family C-terminal domain-containing protein n=1 Tax=Glaciecola sp. XM2 TaxID=1914931 RepID=UPI001BDF5365|nr:CerR family C-terminal domain-containing protein [Glaciecola sp. XM2]MBT1449947.1 CerR family C-terminal domain-containing protein [Glaciecola sp. XM2]
MTISYHTSDDILSSTTAVALLEAGIDQFGQFGLKATTRNIAEKAHANIAAIPYYFRSKQGLYLACMHYIIDNIFREIGEVMIPLESTLSGLTPEQAKHAYLNIMDTYCGFFIEDPRTHTWAQFIMREHANPTDAYHIFSERYYQHMRRVQLKLLGKCFGRSEHDAKIKVQSHTLFGQVLGFLVAKESLLESLNQRELTADDITLIKDVVRQHTNSVLSADL